MSKGRILIVDDEEDLRDVLEHQLKSLGASIELAENGSVALQKISANKYDVILSDISMPEMTGLELLRNIRDRGFDTPFVILTGFGDKTKAVEALRLGAFDFLEKPWDNEKLKMTMRAALEHGILLRGVELELETVMTNLKETSASEPQQSSEQIENMKRIQKSMYLLKAQKANATRKTG